MNTQAAIGGWALSRLTLALLPPLLVGSLWLTPAQMAGPALLLASFVACFGRRGPGPVFWGCAGWSADVLVWLVVREGAASPHHGPWSTAALLGSGIGLAVVLSLSRIPGDRNTAGPTLYPAMSTWVVFVAALTVVAYRLAFSATQHIPNEERSLFIGGVEVHHWNHGVIGALIVGAFASRSGWRFLPRLAAATVLGAAAGSLFDQLGYGLLADVSDAAYGGALSVYTAYGATAAASVVALWWVQRAWDGRPSSLSRPDRLRRGERVVIGHRGAAGISDENTVEAVLAGAALGLAMVEIDVQRTSDGALVLMHDTTVGRTTDGQGRVESLTLADVRQLKTRSGYSVPTLEEVLALPELAEMVLFIDMKRTTGARQELSRVVDATTAAGRVIVDWESFGEASAMKRERPDVCVVVSPFSPFFLCETATACGVDGIDTFHRLLSRRSLRRLSARGMIRTCWFTSDPAQAKRVLDKDVDGLMTDHPDRVVGALGAVSVSVTSDGD